MRVANQEQCAIAKNADLVGGSGGTLGTPSGALLNIRGDMPVAQPFDGRLQHSSQLAAVLLGHQHGQGIAPRSFQATTETRRAPPPITRLQR